jgi:GNAT superfamily N-acetyltransferase
MQSATLIRDATFDDAEILASLGRELGYEPTAAEARSRLEALLRSADHRLFVAEQDGVVVAWCHMCAELSIVNPPFAEIRGLVVTDSLRSSGIGRQLLEEGERWAVAKGLNEVRVRSNVTRERARRFYESAGYVVTKTSNTFVKSLQV